MITKKGEHMWKCTECGAVFETPMQGITYLDGIMIANYKTCPDQECGSDELEIVHLCRCEREYITDEQDRCWQCEKEIDEAMKEARERIMSGNRREFQGATEDMVQWIEREG
jgi:hypothetical protein